MPGHYHKALKKKLPKADSSKKKPASTQAKGSSHRISETSRGKSDLKKAHQSQKKKTLIVKSNKKGLHRKSTKFRFK